MRKILIGLAAVVLTFAFVAPDFASAAEIKMMGIFRWRGLTIDDADGNSRAQDSNQVMDTLMRVRWTAKSEGGKVWAIYELDGFDLDRTGVNGNVRFGTTSGRFGVGVNRWVIDALIPGTTLRFRVGKTDWVEPMREIIGGAGLNRIQGYGVYGKLFGPVSLSLWTTKTSEGLTNATDQDNYYIALPWKVAPAITVTPWIAMEHDKSGTSGSGNPDFKMFWYALHLKAKFGIVSLSTQAIFQGGEAEYGRFEKSPAGGSLKNIDYDGWALLIRLWLSFGKLKVGLYGTFMSGDDDTTSAANRTGTQADNKLTRWVAPRNNGGRLDGPQLFTRRRFSSFASGASFESRHGSGNGGARANGVNIYELLGKYQLTKQLQLQGNISLIRSAAKRSNITGGATFVSDKDIGTEIDLSAKYSFYKSLWGRLTFAYMFRGDYGKNNAAGTRSFDDTWALFSELRHTFKQ